MQDCELVSADAPERSREQQAAIVAADFPRAARLLKHSDFERVYKQGKRHFSSHMTVFYLRQAEDASPSNVSPDNVSPGPFFQGKVARIGFTVGRVLGGAVERNRIKRRLREAVRRRRSLLTGGVDVVINPKKSVRALEFPVLLEEVARAFEAIAKKLPL